jgi:hypothetical protein
MIFFFTCSGRRGIYVGGKALTAGPGSGVMEACEAESQVDDIAAGEDVGLRAYNLAMAITSTLTVVFTGSHCGGLPRLRREVKLGEG